MRHFLRAFRKYADFKGRATRREFWCFVVWDAALILTPVIAMFVVSAVLYATSATAQEAVDAGQGAAVTDAFLWGWSHTAVDYVGFYLLVTILPTSALVVRRLHDTGRSGWWYFLWFVPYVGPVVLLALCALRSQSGENRYGINPDASMTPPIIDDQLTLGGR